VVDAVAVPVAIVVRKSSSDHHAGGKGHHGCGCRRILLHDDDVGVITGNVDGGGCWLNHDDFLLDDDNLFLVRGEVPSCIGQIAYALDRGHYILELDVHRLAESDSPLEIGLHFVKHLRELNENLDARVPLLVIRRIDLTATLLQVAGRFDHVHRRSRGGQNVGDQRIGV
jgi:hypothetical protein